jgi:hypothetical protein
MRDLIENIEIALEELKNFKRSNNIASDDWSTNVTEKVLCLIKENLEKGESLDQRLLRAMKDIYVVSFRNFDGTKLYEAIDCIDSQLSTLFKNYQSLEPLGIDFGKSDPI